MMSPVQIEIYSGADGKPLFASAPVKAPPTFGLPTITSLLNAQGGVLGGKLALEVADTQTNAQAGVDAAQRLVSVAGVNAMVGALSSGVTIPVATTVSAARMVPQISPASTSPASPAPPG